MAKNTKLEVEVPEAPLAGGPAEEQQARMRQPAFELYVARGLEDWVQAEAEISAGKASATEA